MRPTRVEPELDPVVVVAGFDVEVEVVGGGLGLFDSRGGPVSGHAGRRCSLDPQYMHRLRSRRRCFSSSVRCPDEVTWFPGIFGRSGFVFGFVEGLKVAEDEEAAVLIRGVLATGDDWEMDAFLEPDISE